jgi:hypothetical protein
MIVHKLRMINSAWRRLFVWVLKGNLIIWAINAVFLALLGLTGSNWIALLFSNFLSKIALLETGICFIVGGALAFSGSVLPTKAKEYVLKSDEQWSIEKLRKSEKKANRYLILAIILLAESIILGFLGF